MYQKHTRLIVSCLLSAGLMGCLGWNAPSTTHQDQLNRALIAAIKQNDPDKALVLLVQGADPNARDEPTQNPSPWSDKLGGKPPAPSKAPTALLLALGSYFDLTSGRIHFIPRGFPYNNFPLIEALLARGADANATDEKGNTPMMLLTVASMGHESETNHIFRLLIMHGAPINQNIEPREFPFYDARDTLLDRAVEDQDTDMVRWLLLHHADPNIKCDGGETLLKLAILKVNLKIIHMLKQAGARVKKPSAWEKYILDRS